MLFWYSKDSPPLGIYVSTMIACTRPRAGSHSVIFFQGFERYLLPK